MPCSGGKPPRRVERSDVLGFTLTLIVILAFVLGALLGYSAGVRRSESRRAPQRNLARR